MYMWREKIKGDEKNMLFGENLERKRGKNTPSERTLERTAGRKNPHKTQAFDTTWLCR